MGFWDDLWGGITSTIDGVVDWTTGAVDTVVNTTVSVVSAPVNGLMALFGLNPDGTVAETNWWSDAWGWLTGLLSPGTPVPPPEPTIVDTAASLLGQYGVIIALGLGVGAYLVWRK